MPGEVLNWVLGKIPSLKGLSSLQQAAQGSAGVTGGIYKMCRSGPWGHGSVMGLAVFG